MCRLGVAVQRTVFFFIVLPPHRSTLFPYTTLFRSPTPMVWSMFIRTPLALSRRIIGTNCNGSRRVMTPKAPFPISLDRKSTRLNSSHTVISYAVFCLKKKKQKHTHWSDGRKHKLHT